MSVFDPTTTLQAVKSRMQETGLFRLVMIGEPKSPPDTDAVAIWTSSVDVVSTTLTTPITRHLVTVRSYINAFSEEPEVVEIRIGQMIHNVAATFVGEYQLGGSIRAIDIGGIYGESMNTRLGYGDISGTIFRMATTALPLIVDDSGTFDV